MDDTLVDRLTPRPHTTPPQEPIAMLDVGLVLGVNLAAFGATLAQRSEQERRLVRLFDGKRTLAEVIEVSLLGAPRTMELAAALRAAGVLQRMPAPVEVDPLAVRFDAHGEELPPPPTEEEEQALLRGIARAKRARTAAVLIVVAAIFAVALWAFGEPERAPVVIVTPAVSAPLVVEPLEELAALAPAPAVVTRAPPNDVAEARRLHEQSRLSEATTLLEAVVQREPTAVDAWVLLGAVRFDNHDTRGATTAAQRAFALDQKFAPVQMLLAAIALDVNDERTAKAALTKYLELAPKGSDAAEARALLARTRFVR